MSYKNTNQLLSKANTLRLYLHSAFIILLLFNQSILKALYVKNYHFKWSVDFQPVFLLFYMNIIVCIYLIAFVVLKNRPSLNRNQVIISRIVGTIIMFFFFIVFRYFVDQVLDKWLFGITNYDATVTFRYFFYDNLSFSFITILAGLFLKFMDDWLINDRIKQDLEKQNLRLELDFLKSQLNPHFLFNTLNNIQSYIYQDEKNKSIEMIGQLSDFMRFTLYECEEEFISLDKEIRMLAHYVELERVRCEDRIKISFDAKGNFNLYQIPPLLFMPFIENAFKHSTKVHSKESWIKINININEQDNWLELYVGNSFENSTSIKKIGGIGLQNSQKRLQHYFLHKHRLNINYHDSVFELNLNLKPVMLKNISC